MSGRESAVRERVAVTALGDQRLLMAGMDGADYWYGDTWLQLYDWGADAGGWVDLGTDFTGVSASSW